MKKFLLLIGAILLTLSLSACKPGETDNNPVIYVTVYPMQFLVEEIGGDTVTVKRVPGTSTHSDAVDWSAKEIIDMKSADLLFYIHAGADDYIPNRSDAFKDGNVELIDMSQRLTYNLVCYRSAFNTDGTLNDTPCDENSLLPDPHFWLDPVLMLDAATYVKDKLIATYPENEELYNNNFTTLSSSLEKLDMDFQDVAAEADKPVITTVMLFTYWEYQYGFDIVSITPDAHSTESNPGDLINIINLAINNNIKYILFEKNANSPAGDQLLQDLQTTYSIDASAEYIHGLGNITEAESTAGATYITIMYDNLHALEAAIK